MGRPVHQALATRQQIDEVLERIECGESMRDIADSIGCNVATLCRHLDGRVEGAVPDIAQRSARAREESAEAWLQRGREVIASALSKSGDVDPSAARAYAQECARMAAIRNPRYRDKVGIEHSGKVATAPDLSTDELLRIAAQAAQKPDSDA